MPAWVYYRHSKRRKRTFKPRKWSFAVLGAGLMIAGLVASTNLFASPIQNLRFIASVMFLSAVMQAVHALACIGWRYGAMNFASGLFYAVAGLLIMHDPILSAFKVSLVSGILLIDSGMTRIAVGIRDRADGGRGWITAGGIGTSVVGILIVVMWPGVGLWFVGCLLTLDILLQGWCSFEFGIARMSFNQRTSPRGSGAPSTHVGPHPSP